MSETNVLILPTPEGNQLDKELAMHLRHNNILTSIDNGRPTTVNDATVYIVILYDETPLPSLLDLLRSHKKPIVLVEKRSVWWTVKSVCNPAQSGPDVVAHLKRQALVDAWQNLP